MTVVAIQSLHEQAQRFVVGALLKETFQQKEATGQRLPLSVIVLDELNKYAPREGTSPLKDMLIDIAQRGRSLGVLLVGAQQTRQPGGARGPRERVDPGQPAGSMRRRPNARSTAGCSRPPGRARGCSSPARWCEPARGPVPLVVTFPFPPWATRREEVATDGEDPFAGPVASRRCGSSTPPTGTSGVVSASRSHRRRCARRSRRSHGSPTRSGSISSLVSGDVFDRRGSPGRVVVARALGAPAAGRGRPVVVVAGNHDAPGAVRRARAAPAGPRRPRDRRDQGPPTPARCSARRTWASRRSSPASRSCARDG